MNTFPRILIKVKMDCKSSVYDEDLVAHFKPAVISLSIISVILNSALLGVMLKNNKIRENSANCFIFAITVMNLITGVVYVIYEQCFLKVSCAC